MLAERRRLSLFCRAVSDPAQSFTRSLSIVIICVRLEEFSGFADYSGPGAAVQLVWTVNQVLFAEANEARQISFTHPTSAWGSKFHVILELISHQSRSPSGQAGRGRVMCNNQGNSHGSSLRASKTRSDA